ncbi:hypothetical protein KGF54_003309 [Candida jiufengensis]|uniref:uncharacterized protein n=1 Tax=Candida jiufengensis TaxID=497108 RepID=UPI002224E529|nr:uncharacterized protein KGF54_003309 [Candida jiufengensis]KAI5952442.1 hypothetical protein KGF54_003309 [Candida jiufengensis]
MSNTLEVYHSTAFDGLLSLIPAKYFYDDATQDQWQQKKKSKEESKRNKKAKFNQSVKSNADEYLNSYATAKDVMENKSRQAQEKKEQAEAEEDEESEEKIDKEEIEEPVKVGNNGITEDSEEDDFHLNNNNNLIFDDDGNEIEVEEEETTTKPPKDKKNQKASKVISEEEAKKKQENLAKLKERLEQKINSMREKRKAIGTKAAGAPSSREQILNERKRKAELTKQQKRKHEEMEDEEEEEEEENDSDKSDNSDDEDNEDKSVLFGNITFSDGSQLTSNLSSIRKSADKRKQNGPSNNDIKAHLTKLEKKKQKLDSMTPEERNKQTEKDKWQRVISQAEGIKVKDNEKLLKKALKRKEKKKLKSEIEWRDRKQVVKDTVAARAKRREENLLARKNSKGMKRKDKPKLRKFTGILDKKKNSSSQNKKKRAGFEGSVKSKAKR